MNNVDRYRIVSKVDLPVRMRGTFTYSEAYLMCCEWNYWHEASEAAMLEKVEGTI
jgi:hypothetical protein